MKTSFRLVCQKNRRLKSGKIPLMIQLLSGTHRKMYRLGIEIEDSHWDFNKKRLKASCPEYNTIKQIMLAEEKRLNQIVLDAKLEDNEHLIIDKFTTNKELKNFTVGEFYEKLIDDLLLSGKVGNSKSYKSSYSSLVDFNGGKKLSYTFFHIDEAFLNEYELFLRKKKLKDTSIHFQIRTLKAAYNKAKILNPKLRLYYPFDTYKLTKFSRTTINRALTKNEIFRVFNYSTDDLNITFALDIFKISYMCAGISFTDLATLKTENIVNSRLLYIRKKSKSRVSIKLTIEAECLLYKYHKSESKYVLSILDEKIHITPMQIHNRIHKVCHQVNHRLRAVGIELNLSIQLTTYVARHSFATILKRSGVSIEIISELLGHQDLGTTKIYLDTFGNEELDDALKHLF